MSRPTRPIPLPRTGASVWATGQHDAHAQLTRGRYLPDTARDTARIPPAVAEHAIAVYTRPGDTILDPDCGAGTVLVEALRAGRHVVGITDHRRWWPVARGNVSAAKRNGASVDGMVLDGPPNPATAYLSSLTGRIDLLLTALRPHHLDQADRLVRAHADPGRRPMSRLETILAHSRPLLRPGAHVIITVRPRRHRGYLLDLTGAVLAAGRATGLVPVERCIALCAELREDRLVVHASLAQRRAAVRQARAVGHPVCLTAHHDVLVFRVPSEAAPIGSLRTPPWRPPRHGLTPPQPATAAAERKAA